MRPTSWLAALVCLLAPPAPASTSAAAESEKPAVLALAPVATLELDGMDAGPFAIGPDLDRDGVPEILVSHRESPGGERHFAVISPGPKKRLYCFQDFFAWGPGELGAAFADGPDVDGDGTPDLIVGAPGRRAAALLSGASGRLLRSWSSGAAGFGSAVALGGTSAEPIVAVGAPGARKVMVYSGRSGRLLREIRGTTDVVDVAWGRLAKPGDRESAPVAPLPSEIDPTNAWDQRDSWWLTMNEDNDGIRLQLWGPGQPPPTAPDIVPLPGPDGDCPLLWDEVPGPEIDRAARRLLDDLAAALERLSKVPQKNRPAILAALKRIADPQQGLWFWQNDGVCSNPSLHFPDPIGRRDERREYPLQCALGEAAGLLEGHPARPPLPTTTTLRGRAAHRDLLHARDYLSDSPIIDRKKLAALPIVLAVTFSESSEDSGTAVLTVYFSLRRGRLAIAHVIYHDPSA